MIEKIEDTDLVMIVFLIMMFLTLIITIIAPTHSNKDEQIKQLEQSLNEQIQEKQVYINILERKENDIR